MDEVTARDEGKQFATHPEGQYQGVCVDVIDLGEKPETFPGSPTKIAHKVTLIFQTSVTNPDTGKLFEIAKEFTLSMNEKAALRKTLGAWRGKSYSDEEARTVGAPLHKLGGVNASLTIEHKTSAKGRTYANLLNIASWPREAPKRTASNYTRDEYWTRKKEQYAAERAAFLAANAPAPHRTPDAVLASVGAEEDDLPF